MSRLILAVSTGYIVGAAPDHKLWWLFGLAAPILLFLAWGEGRIIKVYQRLIAVAEADHKKDEKCD